MKKWLMHTRLCEDINTYSMNLMVLFYLQTLNLMPSIERLQKNVKEDKALKVGGKYRFQINFIVFCILFRKIFTYVLPKSVYTNEVFFLTLTWKTKIIKKKKYRNTTENF